MFNLVKENFVKNLKLNSNVNKFIFAKTLFALSPNPSDDFLDLVANTLMNRFVYEVEISDEMPSFVDAFVSYECWKNLKKMEQIDITNPCFKKCLKIASEVLMGKLNEKFSSILCFHKKSESHILTNNLVPKFVVDGFSFFDVYM